MAIKLYKESTMEDGTIRLQSQLYIGRSTADFVMRNDGIVECWGNGKKGFGFYEYKEPYQIIENINDMKTQSLK